MSLRALALSGAILALAASSTSGEAPAAPIAGVEVDRLLARLVSAAASIHDYVCTLTKEERVDGTLQPMDTIVIKQRREPRCAYLRWTGGENRGREAIYCPPKYGTELKVHEGSGIASWMTLSLDPHGRAAMDGERHPITEAGIFYTVEELERRFAADRSRLRFERGPRAECLVATQTAPTGHYAHRTEICLDPEHSLPASVEVHDAAGELLERYVYTDYRIDVGLTDRDFDVGNPDYHF